MKPNFCKDSNYIWNKWFYIFIVKKSRVFKWKKLFLNSNLFLLKILLPRRCKIKVSFLFWLVGMSIYLNYQKFPHYSRVDDINARILGGFAQGLSNLTKDGGTHQKYGRNRGWGEVKVRVLPLWKPPNRATSLGMFKGEEGGGRAESSFSIKGKNFDSTSIGNLSSKQKSTPAHPVALQFFFLTLWEWYYQPEYFYSSILKIRFLWTVFLLLKLLHLNMQHCLKITS